MRRKDRQRDRAFAYDVIDRCEYGVVSFDTGEPTPYCIPLSLVRVGDVLYFHCAKEGRKKDLLERNPRVCAAFACGVEAAYLAAEYNYTTFFRSAVVTGTAFPVTDPAEKAAALRALCEKLLPEDMADFDHAAERSLGVTAVWGIRMEEAVGKEKGRKV